MPSFDSSVYKPLFIKTAYDLISEYSTAMARIKNRKDTELVLQDLRRIAHSLKGQSSFMMYAKTALFFKELESFFLILINHPELVTEIVINALPQSEFLLSRIKNIEVKNDDYDYASEMSTIKSLIIQFSEMKSI